MDHTKSLAFEIWQQIITAACTDGGYTGRSLALTDKYFHEQSLSSRFHSLAFNSVRRVEGFIAFLHAQPEGCVPRISHLYLSVLDSTEPSDPPSSYHPPPTGEEEAALPNWVDGFDSAASELLAIAAPTLVTHCVLERSYAEPGLPDNLFGGPFPRLEEFTFHGPLSRISHVRTAATFPKLERLHIISSGYDAPYARAIARLVLGDAPRTLTHFRLSEAYTPPEILRVFLELVGVGDGEGSVPGRAPGARSRIRHVILHSNQPTNLGCYDEPDIDWERPWKELQALGKRVEPTGVRFLFLGWSCWRPMPWADRLLQNWLERTSDIRHHGCWVETEEEVVLDGIPLERCGGGMLWD